MVAEAFEVPLGAVAELTIDADGHAEARIVAEAGSPEAEAFHAKYGDPKVPATIRRFHRGIDACLIADLRLLVLELLKLEDDMRVAASPFAERLEHALDRFTAQRPEDADSENRD